MGHGKLPAQEQGGGAKVAGVRIGLGGLYHVGAWTQILVDVEGTPAGKFFLEVSVPDPDDNVVVYRSEATSIQAPGRQTFRTLFKTGRQAYDLLVRIVDDAGKSIAQRKFQAGKTVGSDLPEGLPYSTRIWIALGNPVGFEEGTSVVSSEGGDHEIARTAVSDLSELPIDWMGYQGVDAVVLSANGVDSQQKTILSGLDNLVPQQEALRGWVGSGGILFLGLGKDIEMFKGSSLGKWFPIQPTSEGELRIFSPLQAFAGKPIRFDGVVPMTNVSVDPRQVVIRGVAAPLVVEAAYQFGRVFYAALDLHQPPFQKWEGAQRFYELSFRRGIEGKAQASATVAGSRLSHGGLTELASQMTRAVSHVEGVRRTTLWGNLLLLLVYLVIIGPLDYLVVCRWLKRPHLTWVTFPILLLLAGGAGLVFARSTNGSISRSQTLSILDIDPVGGTSHGRSWIGYYSPDTSRLTIETETQQLLSEGKTASLPNRLGWWGIPEGSIGGLYRSGGLQLGRREYTSGPQANRLEKTPVQIWSTRTFASEWVGGGEQILTSRLESSGLGNLQGSITWNHKEPLQDCMLVFGNRVFFPRSGRGTADSPRLQQNYVWEPAVGSQTSQRELRGFLTKLQTLTVMKPGVATGDANADVQLQTVASEYNALSGNLADILPIMSFYEYAGGSNYTMLRNDMLGQMDLSHHLRLGQAVLFGRIEGGPIRVKVDQQDLGSGDSHSQTTYVRCLVPVSKVQGRDLREFLSPKKELENKK